MGCFQIKLADTVFLVHAQQESTRKYCEEYLTKARADFQVFVSREDLQYERGIACRENAAYRTLPDSALEATALQRKITELLLPQNVLLFHGSAVAVEEGAYLFTAKSGTGKSTHTRLWREMLGERAVMVNDDKPFLQMTQDGVVAWGSPWNGKHKLSANIGVPLKAICILERSDTNWIKSVQIPEALPMLFQQSQRPQNPSNLVNYMELIDKLANSVELYRMGCNMAPEAARISYEAMSQGRKDANL